MLHNLHFSFHIIFEGLNEFLQLLDYLYTELENHNITINQFIDFTLFHLQRAE